MADNKPQEPKKLTRQESALLLPEGVDPDDYYSALDVEQTATKEEIHKAYRKKALKWHPDKNPDNEDQAQAMFVVVSTAYSVLKDPKKRAIYDKGGKAAVALADGGMNFEDSSELFSQVFDKMFVYGYNEGKEPDRPNSKHGYKQALGGAAAAPLVGVATGAGAFGTGLVVGGLHVVGGIAGGVGNLVGGIKEIRQALKAKKEAKRDDEHDLLQDGANSSAKAEGDEVAAGAAGKNGDDENEGNEGDEGDEGDEPPPPPTVANGLKRATVGLVSAPVAGLFRGLGSLAAGTAVGVVSVGAGIKGAYVNVKQGGAEVRAAKQLEVEQGIPEKIERGEALVRKDYMGKLEEEMKIVEFEMGEELQYLFCYKRLIIQEPEKDKQQASETDEEPEEERKPVEYDEVSNCVFITTVRLAKIEDGKLKENIRLADIKQVHHKKSGAMRWDRIHCTMADGSDKKVGIYSGKVASFFADRLKKKSIVLGSSIPVPTFVKQGGELKSVIAHLTSTGRWIPDEAIMEGEEAEKLLFYSNNGGPFKAMKDLTGNCVLVTSQRIIEVRDGKVVTAVPLDDVGTVEHKKTSKLKSDMLVLTRLDVEEKPSIKVARTKEANFFMQLLVQKGAMLPAAAAAELVADSAQEKEAKQSESSKSDEIPVPVANDTPVVSSEAQQANAEAEAAFASPEDDVD